MNSKDMDIDDSEDKQEVTEENKQQIGEEAKEEIQEEVKEQLIMNVSGSTIGKINNQLNEIDFGSSNISSLSFEGEEIQQEQQPRVETGAILGDFEVINEAREGEPVYENKLGANIVPGDGGQGGEINQDEAKAIIQDEAEGDMQDEAKVIIQDEAEGDMQDEAKVIIQDEAEGNIQDEAKVIIQD
jgi:hypothetical protein